MMFPITETSYHNLTINLKTFFVICPQVGMQALWTTKKSTSDKNICRRKNQAIHLL